MSINHVVVQISAHTHAGNIKLSNEDSIRQDDPFGFTVLADGMGGHASGEIASSLATNVVCVGLRKILTASEFLHESGIEQQVREVVQSANAAVHERSFSDESCAGMGCTLVLCLFWQGKLLVGHVGDSRCYLWRQRLLTQLTKDHSFVQMQLDHGLVSPEEVKRGDYKNYLMRALGTRPKVELDCRWVELEDGDFIITCSDGLVEPIDNDELTQLVAEAVSSESPAQFLVERAMVLGSKDNISVQFIECEMKTATRPFGLKRWIGRLGLN